MKLRVHDLRALIERFALSLGTILSQTDVSRQREIHVLVNPVAGGVVNQRSLRETVRIAESYAAGLHRSTRHTVRVAVHMTERPGHASDIVSELLDRTDGKQLFIVSAGGDGTHGEVLSRLVDVPGTVDATAIRLPMGTGNDGADAASMSEACGLLTFGVRHAGLPYVHVSDAAGRSWDAFNIVSLGLDAFVTDIGNRLKRLVPGDIYKSIADVATLFYEPAVGIGITEAHLRLRDGTEEDVSGNFIIFAVGTSGNRSYGDGKKVLPGTENLCAIETAGLRRKLALKSLLYDGRHTAEPEVLMRECSFVRLEYPGRVAMQLDGEALWLDSGSFPLEMELRHAPIGRITLEPAGHGKS